MKVTINVNEDDENSVSLELTADEDGDVILRIEENSLIIEFDEDTLGP